MIGIQYGFAVVHVALLVCFDLDKVVDVRCHHAVFSVIGLVSRFLYKILHEDIMMRNHNQQTICKAYTSCMVT